MKCAVRKVVLAAVVTHGRALEYADDALRRDQEVVCAAVKNTWTALRHTDKSLLSNRDVAIAVVGQQGRMFAEVPPTLQEDLEVTHRFSQRCRQSAFRNSSHRVHPKLDESLGLAEEEGKVIRCRKEKLYYQKTSADFAFSDRTSNSMKFDSHRKEAEAETEVETEAEAEAGAGAEAEAESGSDADAEAEAKDAFWLEAKSRW